MLKFITRNKTRRNTNELISIHLMLKFITKGDLKKSIKPNFNTSHVEVYHLCKRIERQTVDISIHLMLKFIDVRATLHCFHCNFNTSHVEVYHWAGIAQNMLSTNFNTSHVEVYLTAPTL